MKIDVYTDGSATTMDKPGGWAWVIVIDGVQHFEGSGHMDQATNNDAELMAAIKGLEAVIGIAKPGTKVDLVSDSKLILGWANGSYRFKQLDKMALYESLKKSVRFLNAGTRWVRGHSGNQHNERCDTLANRARLSVTKQEQIVTNKTEGLSNIGTKKNGVISVWYRGKLKVIDLEHNIVEDHDRDRHGQRGSALEVREDRSR